MDPVFRAFLEKQLEEGLHLARNSDILELQPQAPSPVQRYLAIFSCRGLVQGPGGSVLEANRFVVGIVFPDDYLRRAFVPEVITLLSPVNLLHPNGRYPILCIGHLVPGLPLVDVLFQVFEILTFHRFNLVDCLNQHASAYVRANLHRFPLDRRPLRRVTSAAANTLSISPKP